MKRFLIVVASALLTGVSVSSSRAAQQPLAGDWIGTLNFEGKQELIHLHFKVEQDKLTGTLDLPLKEQMNLPISQVRVENSLLHFEWQSKSEALIFDGRLETNAISGNVRQGEVQGALQMMRTVKVGPQVYEQIAGLYEIAPGKVIFIPQHPRGPIFVDYESGGTGFLFPQSENSFFAGPSL
ncbi:MAG: hypothetical protein ACRD8U_10470 [Pyrinomonadaceae bacterium]